MGAGLLEVQVWRDSTPMQGKRHFDQARHARGRLEMADIRLDRTQRAEPYLVGALAIRLEGNR